MNLNALYRYQDNCIAFEDNNTFVEFVSDIYPEEMEVENTNIIHTVPLIWICILVYTVVNITSNYLINANHQLPFSSRY